jgi:hypothetical protein
MPGRGGHSGDDLRIGEGSSAARLVTAVPPVLGRVGVACGCVEGLPQGVEQRRLVRLNGKQEVGVAATHRRGHGRRGAGRVNGDEPSGKLQIRHQFLDGRPLGAGTGLDHADHPAAAQRFDEMMDLATRPGAAQPLAVVCTRPRPPSRRGSPPRRRPAQSGAAYRHRAGSSRDRDAGKTGGTAPRPSRRSRPSRGIRDSNRIISRPNSGCLTGPAR